MRRGMCGYRGFVWDGGKGGLFDVSAEGQAEGGRQGRVRVSEEGMYIVHRDLEEDFLQGGEL